MFPFFQSLGTSSDCHDFSNIMESGLATTSPSSLRTLGCISSGPMDFCTFGFCRRSRTWSSLTARGILPSWSPSCQSSTREGWGERLPVKTEAKKLLSTSAFSSSAVASFDIFFDIDSLSTRLLTRLVFCYGLLTLCSRHCEKRSNWSVAGDMRKGKG